MSAVFGAPAASPPARGPACYRGPGMALPGAILLSPGPLWLVPLALAANPADRLPTPRPEPCVVFTADPDEGEFAAPEGLGYDQVRAALNGVIQHALGCERPAGVAALHMSFELLVGCDGVVKKVEVSDGDGAPAGYLACVSAVIAKADFPAHDLPDGMPITYPVDVAW